jgi:hypothetical protein
MRGSRLGCTTSDGAAGESEWAEKEPVPKQEGQCLWLKYGFNPTEEQGDGAV